MMVDDDLHSDLDPQKIDAALGAVQIDMTDRKAAHRRISARTVRRWTCRPTSGPVAIRHSAKPWRMTPQQVMEEVKESGLRGRGGAGFPTGVKWSFVPMGKDAPRPKYLVANADEMEPGTFKDRFLMEGNPHQLIEGLILAGYAIQADVAYIFLRGEYKLAAERLARAIAEAYAQIPGQEHPGLGLQPGDVSAHQRRPVHVRRGDGTAQRAGRQARQPAREAALPAGVGLWGKPTVVNNVETLATFPTSLQHGAEWFQGLSRTKDAGTKLYGASGKVKRPGLWELPMGTPMREILEEHAGGMRDGLQLSRTCCPAAPPPIFWWRSILTCPWISPKWRKPAAAWGPAP